MFSLHLIYPDFSQNKATIAVKCCWHTLVRIRSTERERKREREREREGGRKRERERESTIVLTTLTKLALKQTKNNSISKDLISFSEQHNRSYKQAFVVRYYLGYTSCSGMKVV